MAHTQLLHSRVALRYSPGLRNIPGEYEGELPSLQGTFRVESRRMDSSEEGEGAVRSIGHPEKTPEFALERYKYILQQIHAINENVYRFLALFQTLATTLVAAALGLFVGHDKWGITRDVAHDGLIGLLLLVTASAAFTIVFIIVGVASWIDYRREECELADQFFLPGFRTPARLRNCLRWYETYIALFIVVATLLLWVLATVYLFPHL